MLQRDLGERTDPFVVLVQARDQVELAAACGEEGLLALDADLLQRLEAVGDEARAEDVNAPQPLVGVALERGQGIGLEPLGAPETRPELQLPVALGYG